MAYQGQQQPPPQGYGVQQQQPPPYGQQETQFQVQIQKENTIYLPEISDSNFISSFQYGNNVVQQQPVPGGAPMPQMPPGANMPVQIFQRDLQSSLQRDPNFPPGLEYLAVLNQVRFWKQL